MGKSIEYANQNHDDDLIGNLEVVCLNKRKYFNIQKDKNLFDQNFEFNYTKKGKPLKGSFIGRKLIDLCDCSDIKKIINIVVYSYDNHQIVYSGEDLLVNQLVVGINIIVKNLKDTFTIYPLKDKFPNRVMMQVKRIEIIQ